MSEEPGEASVRVLHCIPTLGSGGAERQLRMLAPRLVDGGIETSLFARLEPADVSRLAAGGVACHPIRSRGNHSPSLMIELARAIASARPTLIQTWLPQMDILGGIAARLSGIPWILSERSSAAAYPPTLKNRLRRRLGKHARAVIANSEAGIEVWPDHRERQLLPNGIDFAETADAGHLPVEDPAVAGRTVVLSVARLSEEKKLETAIDAIALARGSVPDLLLALVGEGPEEQRLRALAKDRSADGHVHFAGYRSDIPRWLKAATLFIATSRFEGHPNAVLEAAAAGVAMILSDISMHRAVVGDGAIFVPVGDPAALAEAIIRLTGDPRLRARLAASARAAVDELSIDAIADRYADFYREISR